MTRDPRAIALEQGLLPVTRVEGEVVRRPMNERLAHHHVPGISVAVIENDEIAWAEGFGVQEAGTDHRVDAGTIFAGASISKPVAAVVALRLVEQGLLDLDRNVNDVLQSWKIPENEFTAQSPVTLRWLLSHRAGTTVHGFGGADAFPTILESLEGLPPCKNEAVRVNKVPGGPPRYSGGGISVVQLMMEEAAGKPFDALARELVFEPLGMTRSTFTTPLAGDLLRFASRGHNEDGSLIKGGYSWCPQLAAGGIHTTASDYARFIIASRAAFLGKPGAILGPDMARQMMDRNGAPDQGLGWRILGDGESQRFEHGGSCQGYQCETMGYLHRGDGVVVLTNGVGGLQFYWEVINTVADVHGWRGYLPPLKQVQPMSADQFNRYIGTYAFIDGVEGAQLKVWADGDRLMSEIAGMRGGPRHIRMDQNGRLFNGNGPYDTAIEYGADGRAETLIVLEGGATEILRARRVA
jgi:CubicO group peptidase (beta-lactamase class C family)